MVGRWVGEKCWRVARLVALPGLRAAASMPLQALCLGRENPRLGLSNGGGRRVRQLQAKACFGREGASAQQCTLAIDA